jgi:hypothetical protein
MRIRVVAIALAGAAACAALGDNVIREWGQHEEYAEYVVLEREGYGDYAVVILSNNEPVKPWKFEAWDTASWTEGDIDSITIAPGRTVTGIDLRIEPDPSSGHATAYGAANLKHLDVVTNGDASNWLTTLLLKYDYGDVDPALGGTLSVGKADTLQIGGNVVAPSGVDAINITNWVSGCVTIGGDVLSPVNLPMISGQCRISGDILAPVSLGGVWGDLMERSLL